MDCNTRELGLRLPLLPLGLCFSLGPVSLYQLGPTLPSNWQPTQPCYQGLVLFILEESMKIPPFLKIEWTSVWASCGAGHLRWSVTLLGLLYFSEILSFTRTRLRNQTLNQTFLIWNKGKHNANDIPVRFHRLISNRKKE